MLADQSAISIAKSETGHTLDGTDHTSHHEQASMIRRYIAWRNQNVNDQQLRQIVNRAKVA
jgi:hypothetical protein